MAGRFEFRWRQIVHDLSTGLLFRPMAITAGLAALAVLLVGLERHHVLRPWLDGGWFFHSDPAAAQTVLGAIAGSMMAVVSIVYSVMLVALSLASVQFSPRILGSFVRDRVSQRTLGVFIGSFTYCLLVMRAISADPPWVPTWAATAGLLLGLACLLFLIYFIHHIATGIQVTNIVDRIANETTAVIDEVYPRQPSPAVPERSDFNAAVVASTAGYLQLVDYDGLASLAARHGLLIQVTVEPGDYVDRGAELARVAGADVTADNTTQCAEAFDLGATRTMQQDVAFGIRQLVDIALKAISPAVNDPSTATICIDRLGSLLADLARRPTGPRVLTSGGKVVVVAPQPTFTDLVDLAFNQLRQYGRADLAVSIRMLDAIGRTMRSCDSDAGREHLQRHAALIDRGLSESFLPEDRARFERELQTIGAHAARTSTASSGSTAS